MPLSREDAELIALWCDLNPVMAYLQGHEEYKGRLFLPTPDALSRAHHRIRALRPRYADGPARILLTSLETALDFLQPSDPPGMMINAFFDYSMKEPLDADTIATLAGQFSRLLDVYRSLALREWPTELRVLTTINCNNAAGFLESLLREYPDAREPIASLISRITAYRSHFQVSGLTTGGFAEVFPIFERQGTLLGRAGQYQRLLRDLYDYPETAEEIEATATAWLDGTLPVFADSLNRLAGRYGCAPTVEAVEKAIGDLYVIDAGRMVDTIRNIRAVLQKNVSQIVRIVPSYDVRIAETPPWLLNAIPSGAMNIFNAHTDTPYCVFFVTTDPRGSPPGNLIDLIDLIVHEEYGHCVNFLNSACEYDGPLSTAEKLPGPLDAPISEGISFHREWQFLQYLETLRPDTPERRELIGLIEQYSGLDEFTHAYRFVVLKWRIIRFLRAIYDSRVNRDQQTVAGFVIWAAERTGLPQKMIYDQVFGFLDTPGYAPAYSMFGMRLQTIEERAQAGGKDICSLNTFVASAGFGGRTWLEKKIAAWMAHDKRDHF